VFPYNGHEGGAEYDLPRKPPASPEPEPSEPPPPPPSASPAARLRSEAMRALGESVPLRTPEASPQVGPV
ncbi:hypothetical protein AB0Q93_38465, partial [Streptomyces sp. NPDC088184]